MCGFRTGLFWPLLLLLSHISSSVLQLSTSHSLILWPCWIHLLLLFASDNWLEQWNACVSPSPFETRHSVYFLEVLSVLPLSFPFPLTSSVNPYPFPFFSPHLSPSLSLSKFLTLLHVSAFMNECNARDSLLEWVVIAQLTVDHVTLHRSTAILRSRESEREEERESCKK